MSLISELQRRSVFKVGAAYLVIGWLVIQVAATVAPQLDLPAWVARLVTLLVLLGFPVALVLAWAFELTPEGIKVDTAGVGSKRMFVGAAAIALLALGWYFVGAPATRSGSDLDPRSIAVLPFVNMSDDPAQEFFSDGIAEELLNRLAQSPDLKVAARTSAFQFKGKNLDIGDIGRRLKVARVLEGSVRKQGSRLRITAQLIDAASGYHLWSQTYDRDASDVFQVQDEISIAIARALEATLGARSATAASGPDAQLRTIDPAAYDDYLQGRAFLAKRIDDNLRLAVAAFDRAIAKDPGYGPAHSGRAFALMISQYWAGWLPQGEARRLAMESAGRALALDPDNAEAYIVRGNVEAAGLKVVVGRADLERAYALAPGNVDVINFYADFLWYTGALERAAAMKRQAMALDPLAFVHPLNLANILANAGRDAEALPLLQRASALGAGGYADVQVFWSSLRLRRLDDAQAALARTCTAFGDASSFCATQRAGLLAATGRLPEARAGFERWVESAEIRPGLRAGWSAVAWVYSGELHDVPKATAAMRRMLAGVDTFAVCALLYGPQPPQLPEEISRDPDWLAAWNDPRLAELMVEFRANVAALRAGR